MSRRSPLSVFFTPEFVIEMMAAHRANYLLAILPIALETGYSEVVPELEPLKVEWRTTRSVQYRTELVRISTRTL